MREIVAGFGQHFGPSFSEILAHWPEIVGERAARACTPVKLTGRGAQGALHVRASGAAAVLVEAESAQILERITTFCGSPVAGRLKITRAPSRQASRAPTPSTPRRGLSPRAALALQESLAPIEDKGLKAALEKLGCAVYSVDAAKRGPWAR